MTISPKSLLILFYAILISFFPILLTAQYAANELKPNISILMPNIERKIPAWMKQEVFIMSKTELSRSNRFTTLDRSKENYQSLKEEIKKQKEIDHAAGEGGAAQNSLNNAEFQFRNKITDYGVKKLYYEDSETKKKTFRGYEAWVSGSYELEVIGKGSTASSIPFRAVSDIIEDKEEALKSAVRSLEGNVTELLFNVFPISPEIIKIEELNKKKNKVKKVLLLGGAKDDISSGQVFDVFATNTVTYGGREIVDERKIGSIKVSSVRGSELSIASTMGSSTGKAILQSFEKEDLLLKMRLKPSFVEKITSDDTSTTSPPINAGDALKGVINLFKKKGSK